MADNDDATAGTPAGRTDIYNHPHAATLVEAHRALGAARDAFLDGDSARALAGVRDAHRLLLPVDAQRAASLGETAERLSADAAIEAADAGAIVEGLDKHARAIGEQLWPGPARFGYGQSAAARVPENLDNAAARLHGARHALMGGRVDAAAASMGEAASWLVSVGYDDAAGVVVDLREELRRPDAERTPQLPVVADELDHQAFLAGRDARYLQATLGSETFDASDPRLRDPDWPAYEPDPWRLPQDPSDAAVERSDGVMVDHLPGPLEPWDGRFHSELEGSAEDRLGPDLAEVRRLNAASSPLPPAPGPRGVQGGGPSASVGPVHRAAASDRAPGR